MIWASRTRQSMTLLAAAVVALTAVSAHAARSPRKRAARIQTVASAPASASTSTSASAPGVSLKSQIALPKESPRFSPGGSLGYAVSTDLAQARSPRLYNHMLMAGLSLGVNDVESGNEMFSLGLDFTGEYRSLGSEIEDRGRAIELADTDLSIGKAFKLGHWLEGRHKFVLSGVGSLPTSEDSRFEGIKGIFLLSGKVDSDFRGGRLGLNNGLTAFGYAQTYRESPVSGRINPASALAYSLTGRLRLPWGLKFLVGASAKMTHYLDSTQTLSFNNYQMLSFYWNHFRASLKHSNGNHLNERTVSLWYIDEYRRMVSFSMGYDF